MASLARHHLNCFVVGGISDFGDLTSIGTGGSQVLTLVPPVHLPLIEAMKTILPD
ncbi:hypothetical protein HAX54_046681, partial [Datura stramonium]|nr:hypothetical protein [Datura stramonium]